MKREPSVKYVRRWLVPDEIHVNGETVTARYYSGAFDTTGHCQWCGADLLIMMVPYDKVDPAGRSHRAVGRVGYVCRYCQLAARDDLPSATWMPLWEYFDSANLKLAEALQ
jgi:hypothetical protein